jgi:hypothetical protein
MVTDVCEGIGLYRLYGEGLEKLAVVKMPVQCCRQEMKAVFGDFEIKGAGINTFPALKPVIDNDAWTLLFLGGPPKSVSLASPNSDDCLRFPLVC